MNISDKIIRYSDLTTGSLFVIANVDFNTGVFKKYSDSHMTEYDNPFLIKEHLKPIEGNILVKKVDKVDRQFVVTKYVEVIVRSGVITASSEEEARQIFEDSVDLHKSIDRNHITYIDSVSIDAKKVSIDGIHLPSGRPLNFVEYSEDDLAYKVEEILPCGIMEFKEDRILES